MLKLHSTAKKLSVDILFTKKNFQLICLFKNLGFLTNFVIITKKNKMYCRVHLYYYQNQRLGSDLRLISTPSKIFTISLKALSLINKRAGSSVFLISTSRGIQPHVDLIKQKKSGVLVASYSL